MSTNSDNQKTLNMSKKNAQKTPISYLKNGWSDEHHLPFLIVNIETADKKMVFSARKRLKPPKTPKRRPYQDLENGWSLKKLLLPLFQSRIIFFLYNTSVVWTPRRSEDAKSYPNPPTLPEKRPYITAGKAYFMNFVYNLFYSVGSWYYYS